MLLTSPENPTGATWRRHDLEVIASTCAANDAVLVMDHCFAVAGVHQQTELSRIWDLVDIKCQWVAVWDTGKTFGLNEDKLGFVVCGSPTIAAAVDAALAVIQFGVARRQKLFFAELLRRGDLYGHVAELRDICKQNLATAVDVVPEMLTMLPGAGSLLMLDIGALAMSDEQARVRLLGAGVGVVAGNVFFHTEWRPDNFVRIALARRPDYFAEALERFLAILTR